MSLLRDEIMEDVHVGQLPDPQHETPDQVPDGAREFTEEAPALLGSLCDLLQSTCEEMPGAGDGRRASRPKVTAMPASNRSIEKRDPPFDGSTGSCPRYYHACIRDAGKEQQPDCCLDLMVIIHAGDEQEAFDLFPKESILPAGAACPSSYHKCEKRKAGKTWTCCCPDNASEFGELRHANMLSATIDAPTDMVGPYAVTPVLPRGFEPMMLLPTLETGECPSGYSHCVFTPASTGRRRTWCCLDERPLPTVVVGANLATSDSSKDMVVRRTVTPGSAPGSLDSPLIICRGLRQCPSDYSGCQVTVPDTGRSESCCCRSELYELSKASRPISDPSDPHAATVIPPRPLVKDSLSGLMWACPSRRVKC